MPIEPGFLDRLSLSDIDEVHYLITLFSLAAG
jgi:hypothetical protein